MSFKEKITAAVAAAIAKAKQVLSSTDEARYSQTDVLEAGVSRPYASKKEQRDIEAIRANMKRKALINERVAKHKKSLEL